MASEKDNVFWVFDIREDEKVISSESLRYCKGYVEEQVKCGYDAEDYVILKEYVTCECEPAKVTFNKI